MFASDINHLHDLSGGMHGSGTTWHGLIHMVMAISGSPMLKEDQLMKLGSVRGHAVPFWAVVTTQPSAEKRALWHLERQGFAAYGPREKIVRVRHGKKVSEARWMFPRYLFVWIVDRWYDLLTTTGISRLLMNGDQPAQLPNGWVDALKARERGGLITLPKPHRFKIGAVVQVTGGIFDGARGLYRGMTSKQREIVILDVLGARIELASGTLRSAA